MEDNLTSIWPVWASASLSELAANDETVSCPVRKNYSGEEKRGVDRSRIQDYKKMLDPHAVQGMWHKTCAKTKVQTMILCGETMCGISRKRTQTE